MRNWLEYQIYTQTPTLTKVAIRNCWTNTKLCLTWVHHVVFLICIFVFKATKNVKTQQMDWECRYCFFETSLLLKFTILWLEQWNILFKNWSFKEVNNYTDNRLDLLDPEAFPYAQKNCVLVKASRWKLGGHEF